MKNSRDINTIRAKDNRMGLSFYVFILISIIYLVFFVLYMVEVIWFESNRTENQVVPLITLIYILISIYALSSPVLSDLLRIPKPRNRIKVLISSIFFPLTLFLLPFLPFAASFIRLKLKDKANIIQGPAILAKKRVAGILAVISSIAMVLVAVWFWFTLELAFANLFSGPPSLLESFVWTALFQTLLLGFIFIVVLINSFLEKIE